MPPSISAFSVTANTGYNSVSVSSSSASRVEIWRQYSGGSAVRLTRTLTVGSNQIFTDYNAINAQIAQYWAVAVDSGGVEVTSNIFSATQNFTVTFLHKVTRAATTTLSGSLITLLNDEPTERVISVSTDVLHLPAYDKPIIEIGTTVERRWLLPVTIPDLSATTRSLLNGFIENHDVLCCRDPRGRQMFGAVQENRERLDLIGIYPLAITECDFREHIAA